MEKVLFLNDNLKKSLVKLHDIDNEISNITNELSSLNVPYDFRYKNSLVNINSDFKKHSKAINEVIDWVNNSNSTYEDNINNMVKRVSEIDTLKIEKTNSLIIKS